jgi:hypothetical protein
MSKIVKVVMVIGVIALLGYLGACAYANFFSGSSDGKVKLPEAAEARMEVVIVNTGMVYLSNVVEKTGSIVKLVGFWELSGDSFKYRSRELILDERIYGTITVSRRTGK